MGSKITPVILSGGAGARLWPRSRAAAPKQLLRLTGPATMLQMTLERTAGREGFRAPIIVAQDIHAEEIERQLADAGLGLGALVLEPAPRSTAAAIALAALLAAPDELLLVMPSDHLIGDSAAFLEAVERAAPVARQGWLVTFGIQPTRPETGYGYIRRGRKLGPGIHQVERFVEKPPAEVAERLSSDGAHYWNAGIFLFEAGAFLSALGTHAPEVLAAARASVEGGAWAERRFRPVAASFEAAPSVSVDHGVMEKADRIAVVPVAMQWSDVGSWDALYDALQAAEETGTSGDVVAIGCKGSLIQTSGPLVAAVGVEDLIIVATADAVLVMPRGSSQRVREVVEACREGNREELL